MSTHSQIRFRNPVFDALDAMHEKQRAEFAATSERLRKDDPTNLTKVLRHQVLKNYRKEEKSHTRDSDLSRG